jgi:two-component system, sensor histidine kinase and response regulator
MESYEQRIPILDFLYRKSSVNSQGFSETSEKLEDFMREAFDDLQRSKAQLCEQVTDLEARNKELEDYANMVAHDLKEPLTALILTADLIKDVSDLTSEELSEWLLQIKSTAYEMRSIIKSLLLLSQVTRAEAPVGSVHMDRVVANVQARLSYLIKEQQAQIILPKVWPEAMGYGPWIEEVWANYLSNALKYGGRPPCIELGASARSDGMLHFWTRDNGPGIPPEVRTRLFTPSNQIGRISNQGHGLGLSIVLRIIEKLGGQVGVESEVGKGSLFFFTLPATSSTLQTSA